MDIGRNRGATVAALARITRRAAGAVWVVVGPANGAYTHN
jgi:hypothetical protein